MSSPVTKFRRFCTKEQFSAFCCANTPCFLLRKRNKHYVMHATPVNAPIAFLRQEALALTKLSYFLINSSTYRKHACQIHGGHPGVR